MTNIKSVEFINYNYLYYYYHNVMSTFFSVNWFLWKKWHSVGQDTVLWSLVPTFFMIGWIQSGGGCNNTIPIIYKMSTILLLYCVSVTSLLKHYMILTINLYLVHYYTPYRRQLNSKNSCDVWFSRNYDFIFLILFWHACIQFVKYVARKYSLTK